jgi:hypothetical protein
MRMHAHRNAAPALILALLCALCPALRADGVDVKLGLQAGLNMAAAIYNPPALLENEKVENEYRPVFGGGGIVSLTFTGFDLISLESGLLINMKGGKTNLTYEASTIYHPQIEVKLDLKWKLLYLTVPVRARMAFRSAGFVPYVRTGFDLDILLSAKYRQIYQFADERIESESDIKNGSAVDVGLVAGGGVEFPTGRVRMFIEATYCHGTRNVLNPDDPSLNIKLHNRVIGIAAGVRF